MSKIRVELGNAIIDFNAQMTGTVLEVLHDINIVKVLWLDGTVTLENLRNAQRNWYQKKEFWYFP